MRLSRKTTNFTMFLLTVFVLIVLVFIFAMSGVRRPLLYELPEGFRGWAVVRYADPACTSLKTRSIYLVIPFPDMGRGCTSSLMPLNWRYRRYEYVGLNGRRTVIPSSGWANQKRQIWAGFSSLPGPDVRFPEEAFFVGTRAELEKSWAAEPRLREYK